MANPTFTFNDEKMLIKEGYMYLGEVVDPVNIGQPGDGDPLAHFNSFGPVGYTQQGTTSTVINREYATPVFNTPGVDIRTDLTRKEVMINFSSFQIDPNIWELNEGMYVIRDYTANGFTGDIGFIGSDEPTQRRYAVLLETTLVDGTKYSNLFYSARVMSANVGEERSGTEHVTRPVEMRCFPHTDFNLGEPDEAIRSFGCKWLVK